MQDEGISPTTVTYNRAIHACGLNKQATEALKLVSAMRADGVPRDAVTYNSAIKACGDREEWNAVEDLFRWRKEDSVEPNAATYNTAMHAQRRLGKCSKARLFAVGDRNRTRRWADAMCTWKKSAPPTTETKPEFRLVVQGRPRRGRSTQFDWPDYFTFLHSYFRQG